MTSTPAGWYPATGTAQLRYWDGRQWTDQFAAESVSGSGASASTPYIGLNPVRAVQSALVRATNFSGRASRGEFWWFAVVFAASVVGLSAISAAMTDYADTQVSQVVSGGSGLIALAGLLPLLAVTCRRMHDGGRSALWLLVGLVPIAGLAVFVWMLTPSRGVNKWGAPAAKPEYDA